MIKYHKSRFHYKFIIADINAMTIYLVVLPFSRIKGNQKKLIIFIFKLTYWILMFSWRGPCNLERAQIKSFWTIRGIKQSFKGLSPSSALEVFPCFFISSFAFFFQSQKPSRCIFVIFSPLFFSNCWASAITAMNYSFSSLLKWFLCLPTLIRCGSLSDVACWGSMIRSKL